MVAKNYFMVYNKNVRTKGDKQMIELYLNTNDLIRFYINNGTDKTVEMLKEQNGSKGLLEYIIEFDNTTGWAKQVAKHLLDELQVA